MKYIFTPTIFLLLLSACDAPQKTRYPTTPDYSQSQGYDGGSNNNTTTGYSGYDNGGNGQSGDEENTSGDTGQTTSGSQSQPGFGHCTDATPFYGGNIGNFGLCQHDQDERKFKAIFADRDLNVGTCFVPIHIIDGKSFKLGIAECVHNDKDKNYYMTLYKQGAEEINGVMVLRANAVNSYMQCMNAKANYILGIPGCQLDPACIAQAEQYAYTVCTSFKQNHSSDYKQVEFN